MATDGYQEDISDELFDFTCSPCAELTNNREAVRYCNECQDNYCQTCTDMHKMFPAFRGHKLLNNSDFKTFDQQASLPQVLTERCSIHKTKLVDMYCRDHDDVGCTSCMAEKHRSCKAVVTVTDVINKSGARNQDSTLTQRLTSLIEVCKRIGGDIEQSIAKAYKAKQQAIDIITKQHKYLDKALDHLENASKQDVEKIYTKVCTNYKPVKQRMKEYEAKLQKHVTSLRSSKGNAAEPFVSEKLGQKYFSEATDATNTIQ